VKSRYPVVEGTQHLMNPYVMAEGENLLPPFSEWNLHANANVVSSYELDLKPTAQFQISEVSVSVLPGRDYFIPFIEGLPKDTVKYYIHFNEYDAGGVILRQNYLVQGKSITTLPNTVRAV